MDFCIEFCEKYHLITTSGEAEVERWDELLGAIFDHEKWNSGGSIVMDHSDLAISQVTTDDIRRIANMAKRRGSEEGVVRHAVVGPRDLTFGLGRMWQAYVGEDTHVSTAVFRTRAEAIKWVSE